MSRRSKVALLVMAAFVAFVEGPLNPFWIWNAMPIAMAYLVLRATFDSPRLHVAGVVFAALACLIVVFVHIAWLFDLRNVATSPSTADGVFMIAPLVALAVAGAGWVIAWGLSARRPGERRE